MSNSEMAPFTMVFRASEPRKVKRNRQTLSCTACQKRKSRCDRRQPCIACVKRGDDSGCRFGPAPAGGSGVVNGSRQEVQNRLTKLEELVRGLAEQPMPGPGPRLAEQTAGNEHVNGAVSHGKTQQAEVEGLNYSGPTSWSTLVESIRDIQSALDAEEEIEGPEQSVALEPDAVFGDVPPATIGEILNLLPPRQDADRLVTTYFNAKYVAVPFLHTNQFKRRYEKFWKSPESTSLLWISIMLSIMSCAVMIVKVKGIAMSSPEVLADSKTYSHMAVRCLVSGRYLQAKPLSVEAVVMLAHSCNVQKQDSDAAIWTLYALGIRLAQRQGYHRDASKVSPSITPFEAEMRRRVWFMLQSYDLLLSFQQGLPPMTHEDSCDNGPPMNLADDDFDEDSTHLAPRQPIDPLPILAYATKARILPILRRMLRHALGVVPGTPTGARALGEELDKWYESIPPCLKYRSILDTSFTDPNYTIFHRIMLEMVYHMGRFVLYRPFLLGGSPSAICQVALDICRESALKLLDIHFEVDRAIHPGGRLHEDRYMVSSLTLHGFLVAAMILCLELNDCDDMRPEDRKSRVDVLHAAHQMWAARSSTSTDARHASKVLRAILNRVESPNSASSGNQTLGPLTPDASVPNLSRVEHTQAEADPIMTQNYTDGFSVNFDELLPLDSFFTDQEGLDWNSIDRYLRQDFTEEILTDQPLPDMAL